MRAEMYLQQVERLDILIAAARRKIDRLKDTARDISPQTGGERVRSSGCQQKMSENVGRYVDVERDELMPLLRKREEILVTLKRIGNRLQFIVLYEHYFESKTFTQIARDRNYSYAHIIRAHREGLAELQKIIGK